MADKVVFITGSSSGIGRCTARAFQAAGWKVSATMRTPDKEKELHRLPNVITPALDVTRPETILAAIQKTMDSFGHIDALVNNAGYGLTGPFEGTTADQVKRQMETNVFGLMEVTRAVLPHMRARKQGTIVNISSMGGRLTFPYYSVYHATKFAVEGFTDSLRYELSPLGIRVKLIEPGAIKTDFYDRSADSTLAHSPAEYQAHATRVMANMHRVGMKGIPPERVAETIVGAVTSRSLRLRYAVGADANALVFLRRFLPDWAFTFLVRTSVKS